MTVEWSRDDVLAAVRARLLRPGAVTAGFAGVEVVAEGDGMLVAFRWRRDPNTYAVRIGFPAAPESAWTGLPVSSAGEWACDVEFLLMEELDTGLVRRSRRTVRDGRVLLDTRDAPDVWPAGYFVGTVPLDDDAAAADAGFWLAREGLDVGVPRRLIAEARLACWLQAYVDNARGEPLVGHAAASWEDERHTMARLDVAYVLPGVPAGVRRALALLAVREVAEAGALGVVTAIDVPELRELGFGPAGDGGLVLHTRSGA
ncbi:MULTISPECIES: hypothetical protein [unclassified Nonomuraea]|uniref:hypothetical protein n=1 Tax=unclassified Nonomuraea TaxID=2593643 RepID=UPI00340392A7